PWPHTALSALKKFRQPVLFLHGRQDTVIPFKHSVDAEQLTKNTKLVIFENCGHTPQFEHPGLFNDELTRFLNT
ncbi:MAG: alpha/beta hydrolase, partial [Candidatus Thiodiazotropha sp.]